MCSPVIRAFNVCLVRKSLISDRGGGWNYSRIMI
ncbi:hypothetical protein MTR67_001653 [Solanum verrucosum]|uniref:Uncharacterized protein n=1 Tax=Solanum verrucosum TaxID=315347 RepID=A0AAF0PNY2_SOLVR|nr:hypothetical protein MTR67_001653 [Solanum verrucosum]